MQNRIDTKLKEARDEGRTILAPFITIGFPTIPISSKVITSVIEAGSDMLELGIAFSDPLADGPTIQKTSFVALQNGVTVHTALEVVRNLRKQGIQAPVIYMGYYNPFFRYGTEAFARDAIAAGADGVIVPDLPTEEASPFKSVCESHGLYLIPLLAPTSTDKRIEQACLNAKGFIYCVSLTGVTGARRGLQSDIKTLVGRIRKHTNLPVIIGFGVSSRQNVEEIGRIADGAVVGSALLDAVGKAATEDIPKVARNFIKSLIPSERIKYKYKD